MNLRYILQKGFFSYLQEHNRFYARLEELDRSFWSGYITWLNRPQPATGKPLVPMSRRAHLTPIRALLKTIGSHERFGATAYDAVACIPKNPWPGSASKVTPTERITLDHLNQINRVCERLIGEAATRIEKVNSLIKQGQDSSMASSKNSLHARFSPLRDPVVLFNEVNRLFPTMIPREKENKDLRRLAKAARKYHGGWRSICQHFQPFRQNLFPFIYWLARQTAFNPFTLLKLEWDDFVEVSIFGERYIKIQGKKGRAADDQDAFLPVSTALGELGVIEFMHALSEFTKRVRPYLPRHLQKRIFVFVSDTGKEAVRCLERTLPTGTVAVFFRNYGLEPANLKQIRKTVIDEVQLQTGDIVQAMRIGGHKRPDTTLKHYTSAGTRARYQEKLGEVYLLRERWFDSKGVIDPRTRNMTADMDRGAATPGFICLDPFDSPLKTQTKGKLCKAYGECPSCPLSGARPDHPTNAALYLALERAIYAGQGEMAPQTWFERWGPVLLDLRQLLGRIPKEIMDQAQRLSITLPPIG